MAFAQSIARLHHLSSAAVTTLGKVMLDQATPPATKVRAADSILDHTTKAIEIEDIEARVAALEQAASQGNQIRKKTIRSLFPRSAQGAMRTGTRRIAKLEDRFSPTVGKPQLLPWRAMPVGDWHWIWTHAVQADSSRNGFLTNIVDWIGSRELSQCPVGSVEN